MIGNSGYFDISGTKHMRMRVNWKEEYELENNRSYLLVNLQFLAESPAGYYMYTYYPDGTIKVNGNVVKKFSSALGDDYFRVETQDAWYPTNGLGSYESQWLNHNNDGTLSVSVAVDITGYVPGGGAASGWQCSGSGTVELYRIPRASTIRATDGYIESSANIAVYKKADYTHSIQYQFGSLSGYINAEGNAVASEVKFSRDNVNFNLPSSFYNQIPDDPWAKCYLTCRTYYGSTLIGEPQKADFWVYVNPAVCSPTVSGDVVDVFWPAVTGDENVLIRYDSTARCTINTKALKGASIVSKSVNDLEIVDTALDIKMVATDSFTFSATDSRGFTTTYKVKKKLIPYVTLTNNATCVRLGADTNAATLTLNGAFWEGSFGATENYLKVTYTVNGGNPVTLAPVVENGSYQLEVQIPNLDYDKRYTVVVTAEDRLNSRIKELRVNKSIPLADWGEGDFRFNVPLQLYSQYIGPAADPPRPSPTGYADELVAKGFKGIQMIQIGQDADAPEWYIMGQIVSGGESRCSIILFGRSSIYVNVKQDQTWAGWYEISQGGSGGAGQQGPQGEPGPQGKPGPPGPPGPGLKTTIYSNPTRIPYKDTMDLIFYASTEATFTFGFPAKINVALAKGESGWYKFCKTDATSGSFISAKGIRTYINPLEAAKDITVSCSSKYYVVIAIS